ncbi:MAG: hypothetical protein COW03_11030 [Cytophagales bacterium CG12_big_fil_rev_8_21_14_0_65_40_12]|nr:MAG: hypothetical protein COW03_11030 [Cytophagales bacterium CG12_big_fil_rev_8_21_14_0_65_40_12]PIW05648.1 MAG: hypothetical protein COW40_04175 [Cytophagales bacterium CG17_big_fil_post_rev_8_21_14_2_50_40_13]
MNFVQIETKEEFKDAYRLLKQLVPSLLSFDEFQQTYADKEKYGYHLVALYDSSKIVCVAGLRFNVYYEVGKYLFIDDLVVDESLRSKGIGTTMFTKLEEYARKNKCKQIQLDTSVSLHETHKFYYNQNMQTTQYHMTKKV